jgi:RNA polymerase sigma-70 factor (ECF subfamily)
MGWNGLTAGRIAMVQPMRQFTATDEPAAADWVALSRRLRRIAGALTRDDDAADDLVQQTLVTLLARAPEQATNVGYARTTLVRLWLDQQRAWRRWIARLMRFAAGTRTWQADRDSVVESEQVQQVRGALDDLPPQQRLVLALRLIEGLGHAEIAALLGTTLASVRASLHLARQRVRTTIGGEP